MVIFSAMDKEPFKSDPEPTIESDFFGPKNANDYSTVPDRRSEVPDLIPYLNAEQRVVYAGDANVGEIKERPRPSAERALADLMRVEHLREIGDKGPDVAAMSLPEHGEVQQLNLLEDVFGRDSLHVGLAVYETHPKLLESTLRVLT